MNNTDIEVAKQYSTDKNLNIRIHLHQAYSTNKQGWSKWVYQNYEFPQKADILELGCGNGLIWRENCNLVPQDVSIVLTDFSEGMITKVKESLKTAHQFSYKVMNIEEIEYPKHSFDVVIANHMLYHVQDRDRAFQEIKRVLRPNGSFYATTVGLNNMKEYSLLLKEFDDHINYDYGELASGFCLENGEEQLRKYFSIVQLERYEDGLKITNADDLLQYTLSMEGLRDLARVIQEKNEDFRSFLDEKIKRDGAINITKAAGLFKARN